jgi:hypothetical protein
VVDSITSFFNVDRPGDITWAHRVNTRNVLEEYSRSPDVMMMEGDVIYSTEAGGAVMAHGRDHQIDLTFEEWIEAILEAEKGAKIDFKRMKSDAGEPEAVDFCLGVLEKRWDPRVPLMLNSDIFLGPGGEKSSFVPLDPRKFIRRCGEYRRRCNSNAVFSLGWVTGYLEGGRYTGAMITEMLEVAEGPTTFPIRACFVRDSWLQLQKLLDDPQHTLTIWNGEAVSDNLQKWLREETDPARTFYDIIDPRDLSPIRLWEEC